jgi:hypothetical protein
MKEAAAMGGLFHFNRARPVRIGTKRAAERMAGKPAIQPLLLGFLVGAAGFEPTTPSPPHDGA